MNHLRVFILFLALCCWTASAQTSSADRAITTQPIQIQNADMENVLSIYAVLAHRTVLHGPLPVSKFDLDVPSTNKTAAIALVVKALKEKGLSIILDGKKFALVVTDKQASKVVPHSGEIKSEGGKAEGVLNLSSMSFVQVLPLYVQLTGASGFEQTSGFAAPNLSIFLQTETPLTKAEAIYALDIIFQLNGFKMVPTSGNRIKAVWLSPH